MTALFFRRQRQGKREIEEHDRRSERWWELRAWRGSQAYSDSKLYDLALAMAVARRWPEVLSNAVSPGWVPTKMGGAGAPDDLAQGYLTQAWLAVSDEPAALVSGCCFFHKQQQQFPSRGPLHRGPGRAGRLLRAAQRDTAPGVAVTPVGPCYNPAHGQ